MASPYQPYPASKSSGVEWLGDVPAHWEIARLGAVLRERGKQNLDGSTTEVLSVLKDRGVIPYSQKGNIGNKKSDDITRYKIVRAGDIVVNSMNVIIGSVGLSLYDGCLSPVYYVLTSRSEEDDIRYLDACFQTKPFQQSLTRIGNGILAHRMRIPMQLLKSEPFPRPSLKEQRAIVRFLDHADRRIQRYIRAKERLIELLEEQKQAIIHLAVTGQMDVRTGQPYPAYRDSGVEWLGEVPVHWEVRSLGTFGRFFKGSGGTKADETEQGMPCIRYGDLYTRHQFHITESRTCVAPHRAGVYTPVRYGDVLFAGSGETLEEIGKSAVNLIRGSAVCGGDVIVFRPTINVDAEFIGWSTDCREAASQKARMGRGITVMHIYSNNLKYLTVPLPPLPEQRVIALFVGDAERRIRRHISATRRQIALMREYRTRLIADVVTGKLDVRESAADLAETDRSQGTVTEPKPSPTESNLHLTEHDMAKEALT